MKCDAEVLCKMKELPPLLMIRLQRLQFDRSSGSQTKLTNGVQIPLTLDFANFSSLVTLRNGSDSQDSSVDVSDYVLLSVVHHHGGHATCGHYTCHLQKRILDLLV